MDFTALKTAIQNAIKLNGNEEITGDILQGVLLSMVSTLGDSAINDLVTAISNEATARQNGDSTLNGYIEALQGAVNSINTAIGNGFVYAGIATPATTPATGKVFYLALNAGTYTNFGNIEVSQGINILKYNGSTWSLDAFIGIDDAPTPSSNNLVKSGGVFDKVMADGSAFDISAHFASGGTLATYADLSAALTALNTLSAAYKKGGMSIKFVQSSDNKYVQYRYMSSSTAVADFTNVDNWQGIVNIAIFGDTNPISSKVIYPYISRIGNFDIDVKLANSSVECPVDIREGNIVITGSTSAAMWLKFTFYDKNDNIVGNPNSVLSNTTFSINVSLTGDCTKLVVNSANAGTITVNISSDSNIDAQLGKNSNDIVGLYDRTDKIQTLENTKYTTANAFIVGATNKYSLNGSSKIIFYPLEKTGTISYTPKDGVYSVLGLVSSNEVTDGMAVPYSDGGTVFANGTNYTAASKYLLVGIKVLGENRLPDAIYVNGYDILQDIVDNLINLKKEYNDNKNYVLPLVNKIPKIEEVTIGGDSFALTSSTSSTFDCLLPAGNLIFTFGSAASPAWVSVTVKDVEDNVVATSGSILIQANMVHEYIAACDREIHKVIISNINSVVRTVDVVSDGSLSERVKKLEEKVAFDFDISIPSVVYLRTAQEFSIWYRNVIFGSQAFRNGNYAIRCQKKDGNSYAKIGTNCTYDKFNYVPSEAEEFDLEIRIINTYTEIVAFSKVVHFVVKDPTNIVNKSPKIVLIGDSFTDAHSVSKYVWTFLEQDGFTPVSVGVNSAGYGSYKDDAWSGYGIDWFCNTYYGYHRSDRPSSDDVVISGNTYTRNEFIEGSGDKFDFSYYMQHYHNSGSIDCVVFNVGLNDTIWHKLTTSGIQSLLDDLNYMIDSVHDYNSDIKVIICTVTNQPIEDAYTSNYGNDFMTAETGKARQEKWNKALLEHFDTSEYKNAGVYIAPTNANFDANHAIYTTEIEPDKFDSNIKETITNDIHPDAIGAKYIADTIVNTIEGLLT